MKYEKAKERYIHGTESLRVIAKETGIGYYGLGRRSCEEDWPGQRAAYRKEQGLEPVVTHRTKRKADVNWDGMRAAYVTGKKTYKELAEAYGVSVTRVSHRAAEEGWRAEREQHAAARYMICNGGEDAAERKAGPGTVRGGENDGRVFEDAAEIMRAADPGERKEAPYPYEEMMCAYVTQYRSYADIAREYNAPAATVRDYGRRHNWKEMRANYRRFRCTSVLNEDLRKARENAQLIHAAIHTLAIETDAAAKRIAGKDASCKEIREAWWMTEAAMRVNTNASGQLSPEQLARYDAALRKIELAEKKEEPQEPQVVRFELSPELDELAR